MNSHDFKQIRLALGLTQPALADLLRIRSSRAIAYYEAGERGINGPASLVMDLLDAGLIEEIEAMNIIDKATEEPENE